MTSEELGRLTIAELEAAATRIAMALDVLREAGAWTSVARAPATPAPDARPPIRAPVVRFDAAELAERQRILARMRPELPPDIAAAEEGGPRE